MKKLLITLVATSMLWVTAGTASASTVPDAPDIFTTSPSVGAVFIRWHQPGDGGSPITRYTVTASPGNASVVLGPTPNGYPYGFPPYDTPYFETWFSGLTNGTTYTFTVVATNANGDSAPALSPPVTPSAGSFLPPDGATFTVGQGVYPEFLPKDASAVLKIEYIVDGQLLCFREFDPFTCDPPLLLDTSTVGAHTLTFRVYDTELHVTNFVQTYYVSDGQDAAAPTIDLVTPPDGASYTLGQQVNVSFTCADEGGGSGVASCTGDVASGAPLDTSTAGTHTFTVHATDRAGNQRTAAHSYEVLAGSTTETVPAGGGTVTTDPGGIGPTEEVPVQTSVQTSTAGTVVVNEGSTTTEPPSSYSFVGQEVTIEAPSAPDADHPLVLSFSLDASLQPDPSVIHIFRNGVQLASCGPTHSNIPCESIPPTVDAHGDLTITVYTDHASTWNFGLHAPFAYAGFFQPVDNPQTVNSVKAGSAIPVKFSLGGNQGAAVLARAYPVSQKVVCSTTAPIDAIEQTVNAGASSLTFSSSTNQYTYVWKTDTSWSGTCRVLTVKFADGSVRQAIFRFSK